MRKKINATGDYLNGELKQVEFAETLLIFIITFILIGLFVILVLL
jgi:hypothetical protein